MGLVMRLLRTLRGLMPPTTQFILGGVEVMHCAARYLDPRWDNVTVCNGEGEQTFRDYLIEVTTGDLEMERVAGLSFARDGAWHNTPPRSRIRNLDEIPSPYLTGMFSADDLAEVALFETNRGCPFACEFCYWGGAIGERVNKLEVSRVNEEISYLARHRTKTIVVCDANFGMLKRDIDVAQHIASLKREHNAPQRLLYSTAKNNPDRVEQLARILTDAELLHNHSISLQTLNPEALKKASRDNIGRESYLRLQRRLNEWQVPSFVELLWPMPGETLESFKTGVDDLCSMGTQSFTIYPLLWLNNVGYADKTEEFGVVTLTEEDPVSGGQVVIQTNEVSFNEYVDGLLYAMSVYLLHNCRGLYATLSVLASLDAVRPRTVFERFQTFMNEAATQFVSEADESASDLMLSMWQDGRDRFEQMISYVWRGALAYAALHSARDKFDALLSRFVDNEWEDWTRTLAPDQQRLLRCAFE
ncbi:MAG: radical SAM protein, partial [Pseudomonadota bacterium]